MVRTPPARTVGAAREGGGAGPWDAPGNSWRREQGLAAQQEKQCCGIYLKQTAQK